MREWGTSLRDVLLNEAAVEKLGFASPDDAVGWRPNDDFEVAGVVANFVHGSFHDPMEPMALVTNPRDYWFGVAVVPSTELSVTGPDFENRIRSAMSDLVPSPLFSMQSYTRAMNAMYAEETRLRRALTWIARAALLLVVAGLWSVSALIASRREREFGIRRVLGASDHHVFGTTHRAVRGTSCTGVCPRCNGRFSVDQALARQLRVPLRGRSCSSGCGGGWLVDRDVFCGSRVVNPFSCAAPD